MKGPRVRMALQVSFQPRAVCAEDGCDWCRPYSPQATADAKRHTADTGHVTRTIRETWTEYDRPDTEVTSATGG